MSVKKLLVLSAAGLAAIGATAVMAGGPDHMAMPSEPAFQNSVYVDLHGGYTQSNWSDFTGSKLIGIRSDSVFAPTKNGKGGGMGGADLGFKATQHIAVETGWFYIPEVKSAGTGTSIDSVSQPSTVSGKVRSWFAYVAAKLTVPVIENLNLYGKVGAAYRSLAYSPHNTITGGVNSRGHYWAPVFATGIEYMVAHNWILGAQYLHLPGNSEANYARLAFGAPNAAPELNQYTAFVGYDFAV